MPKSISSHLVSIRYLNARSSSAVLVIISAGKSLNYILGADSRVAGIESHFLNNRTLSSLNLNTGTFFSVFYEFTATFFFLNHSSIDMKITTSSIKSVGYDQRHLSSGINSKFMPCRCSHQIPLLSCAGRYSRCLPEPGDGCRNGPLFFQSPSIRAAHPR